MKIAVASQGQNLESMVDPRFGRAYCFIIYDTESDSFEVVDNNQNIHAAQGAGIQAAQMVVEQKPDYAVAGNFGPKAFMVLREANIKPVTWSDGTVAEAVKQIKDNKLKPVDAPNVEGHWS
jgi:predicted Fe-Mo cluster-binding NifX family protein